ncbi:uncharacterized protein RHO25_002562 [Cercospora beticola]|uniref:N-acetyltransferase ECO1 n=2 Tax=Cercospora beticola TaxID=122368 RepID=A0ABZ0NEI6_CERBT|nr:hypothetical protein RHO25_002562 [Cercospora beticola]
MAGMSSSTRELSTRREDFDLSTFRYNASMMSSTPPRASSQRAIFSESAANGVSSPPSSPPDAFPWERKQDESLLTRNNKSVSKTSTTAGPFKNVFSILGKRKPLTPSTDNPRPSKTSKPYNSANDGLQQMQMSLGQKVQKKCLTCGMQYVASSAEDRKLHDKYHKQNVDGYDVGKDFVVKVRQEDKALCVLKGVKVGDAIVYMDCGNSVHRKRKAQEVLEIVQRELGAVEIPEKEIWQGRRRDGGEAPDDPTYKCFLYVRGTKCVAFLLVKRIEQALEVVRPKALEKDKRSATPTREKAEATTRTQSALEKLRARKQQEADAAKAIQDEIEEAAAHPIELSESKHSAVMGISRIWTSSSVRGQGIARCLLNTAINRHNSTIGSREDGKQPTTGDSLRKIGRKQDIAFSQPTAAGAQLARKWFGRAYGWRVYVD